jgi:hypothetical protein
MGMQTGIMEDGIVCMFCMFCIEGIGCIMFAGIIILFMFFMLPACTDAWISAVGHAQTPTDLSHSRSIQHHTTSYN